MSYKEKYMKYKEKYLGLKSQIFGVGSQEYKEKYLGLKSQIFGVGSQESKEKYVGLKRQVGGVINNDQRIFLNNKLTTHINLIHQSELLGGPPPAYVLNMIPDYNREELEQQLNVSNGAIIEGKIYAGVDMIAENKVFGIRRNDKNYYIFTNANVDTLKSIR